jgi:NADPH:quinone reductase-like Zn-dependent oxidoreductase
MLGVRRDGVLSEEFIVKATGVTPIPPSMSYEEAACVPCAGVTAWNAVMEAGRTQPGMWVLVLGTGGVAMWALAIAKCAGAKVVITSSSDDKLAVAAELGADATINYRTSPAWDEDVRRITGGEGVHLVVETGGPATQRRSVLSTRRFGRMSVVAFVGRTEPGQEISTAEAMERFVAMEAMTIGSRQLQLRFLAAAEAFDLKPVIGARIGFAAARDAYRLAAAGSHIGKIVITT